MSKIKTYLLAILAILIVLTWFFADSEETQEQFSERVKISLRNVGNQLLLTDQDSTSLVMPIIELETSKYELSFEHPLSITPDSIVSIIKRSFQKARLPKEYLVEVIQCEDQEVAYSYEIMNYFGDGIIHCSSRILPESCFTIEVRFTGKPAALTRKEVYISSLSILFIILSVIRFRESEQKKLTQKIENASITIGHFQFYPEQNKLVKEAIEIGLSKKECELLAIFVAQPNQVIKRDELIKRVWEDHGVIVGRSLDTYISKLRKKLKDDHRIKITNVHGVGYKLEVNQSAS